MSEELYKNLDNEAPSIDAINKLMPEDIDPRFRDAVTGLLSEYESKFIENKAVKDAIQRWNEKILAIGNIGNFNIKNEMNSAANNINYSPYDLQTA